MNSLNTNNIKWSENVIIADADYIDKVAFDLIVNFERMINRRIQPADMAQWAVCIALDGGLREGEHETQLVLIHSQQSKAMQNFRPSDYEKELNAQAFKDPRLGEFVISSYPTEEKMVKPTHWFLTDSNEYVGRWEFEGVEISDSPYLHMDISQLVGKRQNPVSYINM